MNNKSYSRYRNIKSLIHSVDPISKLICFLLIIVSVFVAQDPISLTTMFLFIVLIALLAKVRFTSYFKILIIIIPFALFMWLIYALVYWSLTEPLIYVGLMSLRLYIFVLLSIIYTNTTREMDIAHSIEWLISPLRYIKVPTYEISMMIMLAIRFIPLLFLDLNRILIAQTSRGVNVINGSLKDKIKGISNALLPMFVISINRSEDVANAMAIRGYKIGNKRSKYVKTKFNVLEVFSLLVTLSMLVTVICMMQGVIY